MMDLLYHLLPTIWFHKLRESTTPCSMSHRPCVTLASMRQLCLHRRPRIPTSVPQTGFSLLTQGTTLVAQVQSTKIQRPILLRKANTQSDTIGRENSCRLPRNTHIKTRNVSSTIRVSRRAQAIYPARIVASEKTLRKMNHNSLCQMTVLARF